MDYVVILAGGSGTRFWPLSRRKRPKQFLKIVGKNSLLKSTLRRSSKIVRSKNIFIITGKIYSGEIKRQVKNFNIPSKNIILEPQPRNTLPAIALASQIISLRDKDANIVVLPSDHYIKGDGAFREAISEALNLSVRNNSLSLIGVKPDRLRLGLGYIVAGKKIGQDAFFIKSFAEKPAKNKAKKLLLKKNIFWNAGIFCFKVDLFLRELKIHQPGLYERIRSVKQLNDIIRIWPAIKPISIDYGLIEKAKNLVMVKGKFQWRDLGAWDTLSELLPKNKGNFVGLDADNTFAFSSEPKKLTAALGIKDTIIIDTPDALLVCRKDKIQDIKRLIEILTKRNKRYV